jgi:microcystin-dependent protein
MPDPRLLLGNTVSHPGPVKKAADEKIVRGKISQIKGTEVFATLAAPYVSSVQVGPLEYVTKPSVGEDCLIGFDASRVGYIIYVASMASVSSIPSGSMVITAAAAAPTGYLLCEGQAVSRTTYAALFTAIGVVYGEGDKATTFNLPDAKNRSLIGVGTHALGAKGGEETVELTEGQMPEHTHVDEGHTHTPEGAGNFVKDGEGAGTKLWGTAGVKVLDVLKTAAGKALLKKAGKSEAHNNMPPYLAVHWMIKI